MNTYPPYAYIYYYIVNVYNVIILIYCIYNTMYIHTYINIYDEHSCRRTCKWKIVLFKLVV